MLQRMHDRIKGWVAGVVIGLLSVPFMLWGVNSYFDYANTEWVARVGDRSISVSEFRNEHQQQLARFQQMLGEQFRVEMFDSARAREQLVDRMVRQALLEARTRESGYRVGDGQLAEEIQKLEIFQIGGQFSREMMKERLSAARMSPAVFDARLRKDILDAQLPDAVARSEFTTPHELQRMVALSEERRSATWIAVPAVGFLPTIVLTDAEVEAWYALNQTRFATEETVALDYLELTPAALAVAAVEATDEQLLDLFAQEEERFKQAERRRASHIVLAVEGTDAAAAETKAKQLLARLAKGEDFAALARAESSDPGSAAEGGSLGWIERGMLVGPFEDNLFAMAPGELRGPIRTEFGIHLIRLDEVNAPQSKPFAEVRAELAAEWRARDLTERFERASEKLADLTFSNSDSLAPAAEALGLAVRRVAGVTRSGGAEVAVEAAVRDAAFAPELIEQARNSAPLALGSDRVVVVRVAAHEPAAMRPLAEVRDQAREALREARAGESAQALAEHIAEQLRGGEIPEAIAKQQRLAAPITRTLQRRGGDAPPEVTRALFAAPKPAGTPVVGTAPLGNGDRLAFRLEAIAAGSVEVLSAEERAARATELAQRYGTVALTAYTDALRAAEQVVVQLEKSR